MLKQKKGNDQSAHKNLPESIMYASIGMIAENRDSKYIVTHDAYVKINKSKFCMEMLNSKEEGTDYVLGSRGSTFCSALCY